MKISILPRHALPLALLAAAAHCGGSISVAEDSGPPRPAALLLSNWKYAHLTPLVTPEADLAAMRAALEGLDTPYEVVELANATGETMRETVESFVSAHSGNPVVLVYVSGHGLQVGGVNYLAGVELDMGRFAERSSALRAAYPAGDAYEAQLRSLQRAFAEESMLSMDWLIARLGEMSPAEAGHSHVKMVFVDACREPFPEDRVEDLAETKSLFGGKSAGGLAPVVVSERPGIFVGLSAAANQVANQNEGERLRLKSPFLAQLGAKGLPDLLWSHYDAGGSASELVEGDLPPSFFTERLAAEIARGGTLEEVFNRAGEAVHRDSAALVREGRLRALQTPAKYSLYYGSYAFGSAPAPVRASALEAELAAAKEELAATRAALEAVESREGPEAAEVDRLRAQVAAAERARDEAERGAAVSATPERPMLSEPPGSPAARPVDPLAAEEAATPGALPPRPARKSIRIVK